MIFQCISHKRSSLPIPSLSGARNSQRAQFLMNYIITWEKMKTPRRNEKEKSYTEDAEKNRWLNIKHYFPWRRSEWWAAKGSREECGAASARHPLSVFLGPVCPHISRQVLTGHQISFCEVRTAHAYCRMTVVAKARQQLECYSRDGS